MICCLIVRRHRLDRLCTSRSSTSVYSDFRFPVMHRGPALQYPLTTSTNTTSTTTTTTTATLAAKSRDLDSIAASYESVGDVTAKRKLTETVSGDAGTGNGNKNGTAAAVVDVGCDWVVSPGWKLRRRATGESNQLPVSDEKLNIVADKATPSGLPENTDDIRSQSAQGKCRRSVHCRRKKIGAR